MNLDKAKQRFWKRVDMIREGTECWPWLGCTNGRYGLVHWVDGRGHTASRVAYMAHHNLTCLPADVVIRHTCDNGMCCNPSHLIPGTVKDNVDDAVERGQHPMGESHGMTHLTEADVIAIRNDPRILREIAAHYACSISTISNIKSGVTWGHIEGPKKKRLNRLTPEQKAAIANDNRTYREIAEEYGCSQATVCGVKKLAS